MRSASRDGGHRSPLEALGIQTPALERLSDYLDLLAYWNRRVNLTGARSPEERARILVAPILLAAPLALSGRLIDVGSGNGSPGLVLAALRDDLEVTLLEPRLRRSAFLREAARRMGLRGVVVLSVRHDAYDGPPARTATLRALALPLRELAPLVAVGGRVLIFGRSPEPEPGFVPVGEPQFPGCAALERCST
jgi:16S rRNA (guanine527-N7)-methyltransferase